MFGDPATCEAPTRPGFNFGIGEMVPEKPTFLHLPVFPHGALQLVPVQMAQDVPLFAESVLARLNRDPGPLSPDDGEKLTCAYAAITHYLGTANLEAFSITPDDLDEIAAGQWVTDSIIGATKRAEFAAWQMDVARALTRHDTAAIEQEVARLGCRFKAFPKKEVLNCDWFWCAKNKTSRIIVVPHPYIRAVLSVYEHLFGRAMMASFGSTAASLQADLRTGNAPIFVKGLDLAQKQAVVSTVCAAREIESTDVSAWECVVFRDRVREKNMLCTCFTDCGPLRVFYEGLEKGVTVTGGVSSTPAQAQHFIWSAHMASTPRISGEGFTSWGNCVANFARVVVARHARKPYTLEALTDTINECRGMVLIEGDDLVHAFGAEVTKAYARLGVIARAEDVPAGQGVFLKIPSDGVYVHPSFDADNGPALKVLSGLFYTSNIHLHSVKERAREQMAKAISALHTSTDKQTRRCAAAIIRSLEAAGHSSKEVATAVEDRAAWAQVQLGGWFVKTFPHGVIGTMREKVAAELGGSTPEEVLESVHAAGAGDQRHFSIPDCVNDEWSARRGQLLSWWARRPWRRPIEWTVTSWAGLAAAIGLLGAPVIACLVAATLVALSLFVATAGSLFYLSNSRKGLARCAMFLVAVWLSVVTLGPLVLLYAFVASVVRFGQWPLELLNHLPSILAGYSATALRHIIGRLTRPLRKWWRRRTRVDLAHPGTVQPQTPRLPQDGHTMRIPAAAPITTECPKWLARAAARRLAGSRRPLRGAELNAQLAAHLECAPQALQRIYYAGGELQFIRLAAVVRRCARVAPGRCGPFFAGLADVLLDEQLVCRSEIAALCPALAEWSRTIGSAVIDVEPPLPDNVPDDVLFTASLAASAKILED